MKLMKKILFLLILFLTSVSNAAEFEVMDMLTVNGITNLKSSATIIVPDTVPSSIWISTSATTPHLNILTNGNIGIGTASPTHKLRVEGGILATSSITASEFYGDGSNLTALGDHLGNHTATLNLNMSGNDIINVGTITASGYVSGARYLINGSTVISTLSGTGSMGIGIEAGKVNTGPYNTYAGYHAGKAHTSEENNSFFGYKAGHGHNETFSINFIFGSKAGYSVTSGYFSNLMGYNAGYSKTTGWHTSFFGANAGYFCAGDKFGMGYQANYKGGGLLCFGSEAGYSSSGNQNICVGAFSSYSNTSGSYSAYVGHMVSYFKGSGEYNAMFGAKAGYGVSGSSFHRTVAIGYRAGYSLTGGYYNVLLGYQAGDIITSGIKNIIIGYDEDVPSAGTDEFLNIGGVIYGDLAAGNIGIGTMSPQKPLHIKGANKAIAVSDDDTAKGEIYWDAANNRMVIKIQ